jgi:hypothetical protein
MLPAAFYLRDERMIANNSLLFTKFLDKKNRFEERSLQMPA